MRKQFNSKLQQFVSTLLTLILVLGFNYGLFAQKDSNELYAYTPDGKIEFKLSAQKLLIKFKGQLNFRDKKSVLSSYTSLKPLESSMLLPSPEVCVAEFTANTSSDREIWNCIAALNANKNIEYANPMLIYADGTMQAAMNRLFVKLHRAGDLALLQEDASQLHFKLTEAYAYDPLIRFIEVDKSCDKNALQLANYLAETKKYAAAETDFLKFLHRFSTNDPNLLNQWSLNNTGSALQFNGTPGCDMSVFNAWTLTTGNASTKVAVIDEGVDLNHPDLINNLLPGFDATQQNSGGAPQGNDAHGTACAGIIAAQGNNNLGIAGVAYNCKIVPVRIAYGNGSSWVTSDAWIGTGIDWAWNQGNADVLSNSWGGGSSSTLINDPIGRAVTQGRGGLGSPVLFSAGNSNLNAAAYPSSLSNTISVIAMNMCNQRKSPNSCDGETWWGSNYGTGADVAAPGVKIFTCDISGAAGYVSGDFLDYFNGTSSACPNAAGVMALLLSANPGLTYTQARQIFEASCDKVGSYGYNANVANQPNGTWSTELGYGRVNAYAALQMANPSACAGAPSNVNTIASGNNFCTPTTVTFALQNMPFNSGFIYQWQSSFDNITYNDIAGETQAVYVANLVNASAYYRCKIKCFDSTYSNPIQVVFIDPSISVFPHTEKFTSSGLPCGWTVQNVNADASTWISMSTSYRTASYSMGYVKNTTLAADDWLFSPALNLIAGTEYKVRFWYKGRSAALPEKLEIKWGAANNAAAMTSPAIFSNTNITHTVYTLANSSGFIPATSGQYYIGFHVMSNANMYDLNIDDITFDVVQPCTTPLQGGTITGPSTIEAGNAQLSAYTLSAYTGLDIQWQYSSNNGATWVDYGGAIYSTANIFFPTVGTYLLRARVSGSNCPDAFSSVKTITVIPRIGDAIGNPILVSSLPYMITYLQTGAASGFTSTYTGPNAQPSNDIFWKFTTGPCADSIIVGTCGSTFDNYVHVLDANGTWIYSMDDGPICGQQAVFTIPVQPNTTYYLVVEGYGTASGLLGLGIQERYNPNNVPSISASGSTAICPGDNLTLTASSGTAYLWSNGATTQSITVNATGTYSVSVTNAATCVKTTSIIISSGVGSVWYIDADADGYGDAGTSLSQCTQPIGYVANNSDCDDNNNLVYTPQTYYVDADADGYGSATTAQFCTAVAPLGYAALTGDCNDNNAAIHPNAVEICGNGIDENCNNQIDENCCNVGLSIVATNAACSGINNGAANLTVSNAAAPVQYQWSNGASSEDLANVVPGTYSVSVSDNNGCTASATVVVGSNNLAPAMPSSINGPSGACRNQTNVVFSVTPVPNATSYIWTLPTGATGSSTSNSITLSFSGTYNTGSICVRAANACGQSAQFCRNIIRYTGNPGTPGTISGLSTGVCPSTTQTYSVAALPNATSYTWTAPTNATIISGQGSNTVTVSFSASFGTSGTLSVRSVNCFGTSAASNLTISRTPATPSAISSVSSVCFNQQGIPFSVTNTPGHSYLWTVPAGCTVASGSGSNAITVNWGSASGTVSVRASVTCANSALRSKAITASNCVARTIMENENANFEISLYPNPSTSFITLDIKGIQTEQFEYTIFDVNARVIQHVNALSTDGSYVQRIDCSHLTSGLYLLRYKDQSGEQKDIKFIKQ